MTISAFADVETFQFESRLASRTFNFSLRRPEPLEYARRDPASANK